MKKVICTATCYMPTNKESPKFERYEDEKGRDEDIYEIPDSRLKEFLATGNFKLAEK